MEHKTQDRNMTTATANNDRHPTTEAQRFKYTGKQAKQDNKGVWLIINTWETNNQEKLQRTTKHGTKQEITKVHTRQGEHKTGIMTIMNQQIYCLLICKLKKLLI